MRVLLQFAVAMSAVFAGWTVAASVAGLRTSRPDLAKSANRGHLASTLCAAAATAGLVGGLLLHDFSMRFVAQSSSSVMPLRYTPSALLSAPGGALLAFAAVVGCLGLVAARAHTGPSRAWLVGAITAASFVALVLVTDAEPFALHRAAGDGAGLSPDLQRGAAGLHAIGLLLGAACATAAFADTLAAVATRSVDDAWSRRVRRWNALAFTGIFAGIIAGARWYAMNPARGAWMDEPATALWLLPCAMAAWLLHLDTGVQDPRRVATRLFLVTGVFMAALGALAFGNGAFVRGLQPAGSSHAGAWIGLLPAGALLVLVGRLRLGAGLLAVARVEHQQRGSPAAAWLAQAGVVLLLAAAVGSRFAHTHEVRLGDAEIFRARDPFGHQWQFVSQGMSTLQRENYASLTVSLLTERDGTRWPMLSAEARSYVLADGDEPAAPAFPAGRLAGLFMETRLAVTQPDGRRPGLRITFVPLAPWLVVGAWLVALGTVLPLLAPFAPRESRPA